MQKFWVPLGICVLLLLVTTGIAGFLLDFPRFYSLSKNGQSATGIVVSKDRENHMSIRFRYRVDGQEYFSVGNAGDIGKTFDSIEIGEPVPIAYDAANNQSAVMGEPEKYLFSSIRGMVFVFLGAGLFSLLYLLRRR